MEKLKMHTQDVAEANIEKIGQLFPNCLTERINENGKPEMAIDFDKLKQELSKEVVEGNQERYQFTWPGKREAMRLANTPSNMTLRPDRESSVDFDNTENLYIEGDNLEVLKLLREDYLGKIKLIFIDPPYNTGNDFVYEDDFSQTSGEFMDKSGMFDESGNMLLDKYSVNSESNGRFHTDWLNMLYPRLRVAKDLLANDGVIFISIDDNEVFNLKKVCDEIFGSDNYVNTISLKLKNIAGASGGGEDKRLKKNMEYILFYAKNYSALPPLQNVYSYTPIFELVEQYRKEDISWKYTTALIDPGDKVYVGSTTDGDGNEIKIYRRDNYSIKSISQIMKAEQISEREAYSKYAACLFQTAMPQSSIRPRVMKKVQEIGIESDLYSIEYVPKSGKNKGQLYEQFYKGDSFRLFAWLRDVSEEIDGVLYKKDIQGTFWDFVGETKNLTKEGNVAFPNGKKPLKLLKQIISLSCGPDDIVLDFFSGSATTGHAVIESNYEDGGSRKFIMVQLPEKISKNDPSYENGFDTICDLGEERLRRAALSLKPNDNDNNLFEENNAIYSIDTGFRVLKLDTSNMEDVYYKPEEFSETSLFEDNVKPDRTPEDLLFQVMLECNLPLSAKIERKTIAGKEVFNVNESYLLACFDEDVNETVITEVAKLKPYYFIMRDKSLSSDNVADNFEQIFNAYSKDTIRKIL